MINEEGLRDWFGKSKSKDGKSGWVNVVTGGTCASDKPGEGTPKCVSSAKRASMTKAERLSASRRKKAADPGQQQKTGAAKPTYVSTDSKKKMKEESFNEEDKKGSGSGKKDACYKKVKASASVWPSAYASGRLVQCRKKGAANYGKSKNEEFLALPEMSDYQINAMRNAGIEVEVVFEMAPAVYDTGKANIKKGMGMASPAYKRKREQQTLNAREKMAIAAEETEEVGEGVISGIETSRKIREKLAKRKEMEEDSDPCWDSHKKVGMKNKGGKMVPNCVPKEEVEHLEERVKLPSKMGNIYLVSFTWLGRFMMMKVFFPTVGKPTRMQVQIGMTKIYPGCRVTRYDMAPQQPQEPLLVIPGDEEYRFLDKDQTNMYGEDKDWIQNATKDMRTDKPCTGDKFGSETCPPGSKRYNLAKTFRSMAKDRKAKKSKEVEEELNLTSRQYNDLQTRRQLKDTRRSRAAAHKSMNQPSTKPTMPSSVKEGTCDKGEYFCNDDQKCKPIPKGAKVNNDGILEGAAWTKKSGKNSEGGLNEKGRKSYEADNPGSDLKAPSKKVGNPRRKSFCARMKGMRKRQKPSNNTGDDRLSKSLRAWNC